MLVRSRLGVLLVILVVLTVVTPALAAPEPGTMVWGVHVTLVSRWLDPGETEALITPFMVLYALHDALVKPMPGNISTPSLAESWSVSKDGITYDFTLRKNAKFHNGDPVTAEDVKFTFERYKGASARLLKDKVKEIQVVAANRVRFVLKEAWPDFMAFYGTSATGASWIVPKKYVEKVGEEGYKKAPVGAGPFKFVSFQPGIELVLEAFPDYWRKPPQVKRARWTSRTSSWARSPKSCAARPASRSLLPCSTESIGSTSSTSGTRNHPGTTAASAKRPAWSSTATRSIRPRCWAMARPREGSCLRSSTSR